MRPAASCPSRTIRAATPADAPQIEQLFAKVWPLTAADPTPQGWAWLAEHDLAWWQATLAEPSMGCFVAEYGQVQGFVLVDLDAGKLDKLYVHPDQWGHGTGDVLHAVAIAALNLSEHRRVSLECRDDNPRAQAFYRRRGWTEGEALDWAGHRWHKQLGSRAPQPITSR